MTKPVSDAMPRGICDQPAQIAPRDRLNTLFAIQCDSRAWRFHAHNSAYVRPVPWRLRLEASISDSFDISGWDLGKAPGCMIHTKVEAEDTRTGPATGALIGTERAEAWLAQTATQGTRDHGAARHQRITRLAPK